MNIKKDNWTNIRILHWWNYKLNYSMKIYVLNEIMKQIIDNQIVFKD